MSEDKLSELILAERKLLQAETAAAAAKAEEIKTKVALTFLEVLDSVFALREPKVVVVEGGESIRWDISPAILMFMPAGKHNFVLEPTNRGWMSNTISFSIVIDEKNKSWVSMSTPWYVAQRTGYPFDEETEMLSALDRASEYVGKFKDNKSGIPPEHEVFKDIDDAIRNYVKVTPARVEKRMLEHVAKLETEIAEVKKKLEELES